MKKGLYYEVSLFLFCPFNSKKGKTLNIKQKKPCCLISYVRCIFDFNNSSL